MMVSRSDRLKLPTRGFDVRCHETKIEVGPAGLALPGSAEIDG
jgi:hypothetical protein